MIKWRCKNYEPYAHGFYDGQIKGANDFVKYLGRRLASVKIEPTERAKLYGDIDRYIKDYEVKSNSKIDKINKAKYEQ